MSRFAPVDLSALPPPEVIETLDFETLYADLRDQVIDARPELAEALALESEPAVKVLEVIAYTLLQTRARINDAARAVMLPFATGADLEVLSAYFGVTRAPDEPDTRLRERTRLALQAYSSAGPAGAYRYHAMSASPLVRDVMVDSPEPGAVRVVVMSSDSAGTPDTALLATVAEAVNAEDVRVLTDAVTVEAASQIVFAVDAAIEVSGAEATLVIAAARAAMLAYFERRRGLGLRISRSAIIAALHVDGVESVSLAQPAADIEPAADEFAICLSITLAEPGGMVAM